MVGLVSRLILLCIIVDTVIWHCCSILFNPLLKSSVIHYGLNNKLVGLVHFLHLRLALLDMGLDACDFFRLDVQSEPSSSGW